MADDRAMCEIHHKMRHVAQLTRYNDNAGNVHYRCDQHNQCKAGQGQRFQPYPNPQGASGVPDPYDPYTQQAQMQGLVSALQQQGRHDLGYSQAASGWPSTVPYFGGVAWNPAAFADSTASQGQAQPTDGARVRCTQHGKQRSSNAMEWNGRLNGWVCRTGMQCKNSAAEGGRPREGNHPEAAEVCQLHGKRRNKAFLLTMPDGTVQCQEGHQCRTGTANEGATSNTNNSGGTGEYFNDVPLEPIGGVRWPM